jgi:hypothetical protein
MGAWTHPQHFVFVLQVLWVCPSTRCVFIMYCVQGKCCGSMPKLVYSVVVGLPLFSIMSPSTKAL